MISGKSAPRIAALAFDLGNVLVRVDHLRFCWRLAPLAGLSPREIYFQVFESGLEPGYDTGRISSREFYRLVQERFGLDLAYPDFAALWRDIFDPLDEMEEAVARLAPRYPLFMLSNTNPIHFEYIEERFPSLLRHFQGFILSYRVGSRKPEAAIYQALIRLAGRSPRDILYLDDKLPFVEAARAQGLTAWHFTSPEDFFGDLRRHGLW